MNIDRRLKNSYEKLANHYEKDVDTKSFNAYYERPAMTRLIGNVNGLKILDAGCGAGYYMELMINKGAKEVVGIDFSENMVAAAKRRIKDNGKVFLHNLNEDLPFEDSYFDLIISSLTLHYVKDLNKVFMELSRVLKKDGHIVISIHHPMMTYLYFQIENYFEEVLLEDRINGIPVFFYHRPLEMIINAFAKNNLFIERIIEPKPIKKFMEQDEKNYKKLMKKPQFILIKGIKK
ncbi:hypothetical protein XO10_09470 [Marinitoga sp. 1135]|uniref:class I SAM-dependent methyltransferase n=1 Tax=unclassified Marinitoga TaxID=2640159 RepID=UPI001586D4CC|nr:MULTISPECIES: class I SAM-dependent methyltransferase [unclassified Marinitoga]NUU96479.1 hypothetical protein [Marinitoga sp. 1135]NUU98399.1 hypothetical protein [Marinitoga sp. 1138]